MQNEFLLLEWTIVNLDWDDVRIPWDFLVSITWKDLEYVEFFKKRVRDLCLDYNSILKINTHMWLIEVNPKLLLSIQ